MVTLIALPAIWLANRDNGERSSTRPNVAAVGLDPGTADHSAAVGVAQTSFDPMGDAGAMYLQPVRSDQPEASYTVVVGTTPDELVAVTKASYSKSIPGGACRLRGVPTGQRVTVVNVASGREVTCTITNGSSVEPETVTMNPAQFQQIAALTSAPIHVEVRQ